MDYEFSDSSIEHREFKLTIYKLPESEKCNLTISPIKLIVNYIFSGCLVSPAPSFKQVLETIDAEEDNGTIVHEMDYDYHTQTINFYKKDDNGVLTMIAYTDDIYKEDYDGEINDSRWHIRKSKDSRYAYIYKIEHKHKQKITLKTRAFKSIYM